MISPLDFFAGMYSVAERYVVQKQEIMPEVAVEVLIRLVDVGVTEDGGLTGLGADD